MSEFNPRAAAERLTALREAPSHAQKSGWQGFLDSYERYVGNLPVGPQKTGAGLGGLLMELGGEIVNPLFESYVRSRVAQEGAPIYDDGGKYVSGANMQPLDAFNAASLGPVSGVVGRAAGAIPRGALGSGGSDMLSGAKGIRAYHGSPHDGYGISTDTPDDEAIRIIHQFLTDNEPTLSRYVGLRMDDAAVPTGHRFEPSRVWDDGVPTEDYLPGTSGVLIADLDKGLSARDVARAWSGVGGYDGKRVRVIGSDYGEHGYDAGEFVFKNGQAIFANPDNASLPYLTTNQDRQ